nr:leukocyte surface antigen CD53-like [Onthophagus taurus]
MEKRYFGIYLIIYLIFGIGLLIVGLIFSTSVHPNLENYENDTQEFIKNIDKSYLVASGTRSAFISYGTVIIILVLYGCCGLVLEKRGLLKSFIYAISLVSSFKLGAGLYIFINIISMKFAVGIRKLVLENFTMMEIERKLLKVQMFLEETYNCCGIDSYRDYRIVFGWVKYTGTCCNEFNETCNLIDKIKPDGCGLKLVEAFHYSFIPLGIVTLVICLVEAIGIGVAFKFLRKIKRREGFFTENGHQTTTSV